MSAQLYLNAVRFDGLKVPCIRWGWAIFRERTCPVMSKDTLWWAVQKWLNISTCCLFLDLDGPTEAAAMRPHVKLLWLLVIIRPHRILRTQVRFIVNDWVA